MFGILKAAPDQDRISDAQVIDSQYKYWRVRILYSMWLGYAIFYFTRNCLQYALPIMQKDLHLAYTQIGLIFTIFSIVYGVSKFFSGAMADRSSPRYFMAFGLIITGVLDIIFGLSSSLFLFVSAWLINAFFQGWGWPPCARLLTHWYSQSERGFWWGLWNTCHNVGGFAIALIVPIAISLWNWRAGMIIPGVIGILMGLFMINRLRDVPTSMGLPPVEEYKNDYPIGKKAFEKSRTPPMMEILRKYVLANPYMWLLGLAYAMVYVVRQAFYTWGTVYLFQHLHFSLFNSDFAGGLFEIGGLLGSLVAGILSDRLFSSRRGPMNVIYCLGMLAVVLVFWLFTGANYLANVAIIFCLGFVVFGPQMLVGMSAAELSHREAAGASTGFAALFAYLGAGLAGYPLGVVLTYWGWSGFFIILAICSSIATILLAFTWHAKSHPKLRDEIQLEEAIN